MSRNFKILGINHLGIVPKDPSKAEYFFNNILNLKNLGTEHVNEQSTIVTMFHSSSADTIKSTRLEILVPDQNPNGPIQKYLEKKGGGIHHIALEVDSIDQALEFLKNQGVKLIDEVPRDGAHESKIAFIHPESCGGILVELVQTKTSNE